MALWMIIPGCDCSGCTAARLRESMSAETFAAIAVAVSSVNRSFSSLAAALGEVELPPPPEDPCGTVEGYRMHLQADETPCPACKEAEYADLDAHWSDEGRWARSLGLM